jgi:thiamine-phosphate pyrophosphorylase
MTDAVQSRLYLLTPPLAEGGFADFAPVLGDVLSAGDVACVLARLAPVADSEAKSLISRLVEVVGRAKAALLTDNDPRLAVRAGADGAHIHVHGGAGALRDAVKSLKPDRIVGAGLLRSRDDAMSAGEADVDYVMFGEPRPDGFIPWAEETLERVAWWAEIFEPPCVGFAARLGDIGPLVAAGADFIALGDAIWRADRPAEALAQAQLALLAPQAS